MRNDRIHEVLTELSLDLPIRRQVLDRGWLQLEEWMGGDDAVARGARICYQSTASSQQADARLIARLLGSEPRHNTVFEHAVFRWGVKCPLFVARQWMRHRMASYNERSLRYCISEREYYVPDRLSGDAESVTAYRGHMETSFELYERLIADGWRREQARGVLGVAIYTEFIWTVNAWSLMNWLEKRLDKGAQWEHRQYAEAALALFEQVMPITAGTFIEKVLAR